MDVDGRVMRMDSFSKVIAPGSRVGWITASEQIVERFIRHNECSNQNPSGISQMVLYKLLDESWGHGGYLQWLINLRLQYTKRRDTILAACEKYLPKEIVSWNPPAAGMFVCLPSLPPLLTNSPSSGSNSTTTCTPIPAVQTTKRSSKSKKKSSIPLSIRASSSREAAGSQRRKLTSCPRTCFSGPLLRRHRRIR